MTLRVLVLGLCFFLGVAAPVFGQEDSPDDSSKEGEAVVVKGTKFYVIDVKDGIDSPILFAIRNGVKEAIEKKSEVVVLDMDTPGGRVDITLEIMEILDKFPGKTITYVSGDATSAGAIIASVTNEIYMASRSTIGSAEAVSGGGEDIQESMQRKIRSYLNSKLEAYTDQYPFRAEVIKAMMDPTFEFKIGDEVISPKDELLNLNAKRAHQEYGDPPLPLLGSGIVDDLDALLDSLSVSGEKTVDRFESTWSLDLASLLVSIAPLLITVGMIGIYIEFQTPGFGFPGIVGVSAFVIAIFGHHTAGLSGSEPLLLFVLGVALLAVEIFLFPGMLVFALSGLALMVGSLIWSMTDIWPEGTPNFEWNFGMFVGPLSDVAVGMVFGVIGILILIRFLPRTAFRSKMILDAELAGTSQGAVSMSAATASLVGAEGTAVSDLFPSGQIEVDGSFYEARLDSGSLEKGRGVKVIAKSPFGYIVEELKQ